MRYTKFKPGKNPGPYEKYLEQGPSKLSDEELLAIILRTGTKDASALELAEQILRLRKESGLGILALYHVSLEELMDINGIGQVKAIKLKCIAELSSRMASARIKGDLIADQPEKIAAFYMEQMRHLDHEEVTLLLLDERNAVMASTVVGKGTLHSSVVSPGDIMRTAFHHRAAGILLLHNHPGGDPTPSDGDMEFTARLLYTSGVCDIALMDHIIIGDGRYYSYRENGLFTDKKRTEQT